MPPTSNPLTANVPGLILLILIIAVPLALMASIAVLFLYRRAVLRGMRARASSGAIEPVPPESPVSSDKPVRAPLRIEILDPVPGSAGSPAANSLYSDLLRGPWRTAAVYGVAGSCYALVTTIIFLTATGGGSGLLRFLITFWYYAWPVVITILLVAAATWRTRWMILTVYFLTIVLLGGIAVLGNSLTRWLDILLLWLLTNFPAALLLLAFLNRRVQAVGPLMLTFMIFAATGMVVLPPLVILNGRLVNLVVEVGVALGLGGGEIYLALMAIGFILCGAVGWMVLYGIGSWYQRRKISEQSITIDAIWLLFGLFQSIGLLTEGGGWFLAGLFSFTVYKIVALAGFAFVRRQEPPEESPPSLLVLRVFSLGRRSERLFDALAMHWRLVGAIRLIAGPDLATTTMEPHEFLEFLSGKLTRRFIDSSQTLERRLAQMESHPDHDGQFRVDDFFCYDDTWRMVLSRLVRASDAVIMDLRGFSSGNAGCIFEIDELINLMPLERVVFIVDNTTDETFLHQVMQQSWARMGPASPNRVSDCGEPNLLRLNRLGAAELKKLLHSLSSAVSRAPTVELPA